MAMIVPMATAIRMLTAGEGGIEEEGGGHRIGNMILIPMALRWVRRGATEVTPGMREGERIGNETGKVAIGSGEGTVGSAQGRDKYKA